MPSLAMRGRLVSDDLACGVPPCEPGPQLLMDDPAQADFCDLSRFFAHGGAGLTLLLRGPL